MTECSTCVHPDCNATKREDKLTCMEHDHIEPAAQLFVQCSESIYDHMERVFGDWARQQTKD